MMEENKDKKFYKMLIAIIPIIIGRNSIIDFTNTSYYSLIAILSFIGGSWILGVSFFDMINYFTKIFDKDESEKLFEKLSGVFLNITYIFLGINYIIIAANYLF